MSSEAEKMAVRVRAEGDLGTICLVGPCALSGRTFAAQNGQPRLLARHTEGGRLGLVCFRCASTDGDALNRRLLSEARRLRREASRLERLVGAGVTIDPAARETASTAIAGTKTGL